MQTYDTEVMHKTYLHIW